MARNSLWFGRFFPRTLRPINTHPALHAPNADVGIFLDTPNCGCDAGTSSQRSTDMSTNFRLTAISLALAALAVTGCGPIADRPSADTLIAAKVATAPSLEALASDPAWTKAEALKISLSGGAN